MRIAETIIAEAAFDPARLERSLALSGQRTEPGKYLVSGGQEQHWVNLIDNPRCDCGDYLWRERTCKHILAALLREGDERVIRALGSLVHELRAA
jgi:hypothetical protein